MPNFWPKSHALSSALNKRIVFIALKSCIKEVDDKKKTKSNILLQTNYKKYFTS